MSITKKYYLGDDPESPGTFNIPKIWKGTGTVPNRVLAHEITEADYNIAVNNAVAALPPKGDNLRDEVIVLQAQVADLLSRMSAVELCVQDCLNSGSGSGSA